MRSKIRFQTPQLEALQSVDLSRPFLGDGVQGNARAFVVEAGADGWTMNAGRVHGIMPIEEDNAAEVAIFRFDASDTDLSDLSRALGIADVSKVMSTISYLRLRGSGLDASRAIGLEAGARARERHRHRIGG